MPWLPNGLQLDDAMFPPRQERAPGALSIPPRTRRPGNRPAARILIRPQPGFYVMRQRANRPLVPALIYQLCPMVLPEPQFVSGPHPDEWCRPLARSPRYEARINNRRCDIDWVWTARTLRPVSRAEYESRLRGGAHPAPPSRPQSRTPRPTAGLAALPPLF